MNIFDQTYIGIFKSCKDRKWRNANTIAVLQVSILQIGCLLGLGTLFAEFASNMNMSTMHSAKAWTLFTLISVLLLFINWMKYSGKKRNQLRMKSKKVWHSTYSGWLLWLLPSLVLIVSIALTVVLNS